VTVTVRRVGVLVALVGLLFGLLVAVSGENFGRTETIIVPNVQTGQPMELEVEALPPGSAEAADRVYNDCSRRATNGLQFRRTGTTTWTRMYCGQYAPLVGYDIISWVRDQNGPICVYYGSTLAGCAGINNGFYVGSKAGYTATLRTQTNRT
jgi:hypothetical protein